MLPAAPWSRGKHGHEKKGDVQSAKQGRAVRAMDSRGRLKKSSALSFSMPDVTRASFPASLLSPLSPTQEFPVYEEREEEEEAGG